MSAAKADQPPGGLRFPPLAALLLFSNFIGFRWFPVGYLGRSQHIANRDRYQHNDP
jgi:hypothetical protein